MDGRTFNKIFKDTNVMDGKRFSMTDGDLLFAKWKPRGSRTMEYEDFQMALGDVAKKRSIDVGTLEGHLTKAAQNGPAFQGTKVVGGGPTQFNDRSTFTGTHTMGGPSTDTMVVSDLGTLINRDVAFNDALNRREGRIGSGVRVACEEKLH